MNKSAETYFLTKDELINLIILIYHEKNKDFPTNLVLSKIFYFTFAYASSKIKKFKTISNSLKNTDGFIPYFEYICDESEVCFEARIEGPIEVDIRENFRYTSGIIFKGKQILNNLECGFKHRYQYGEFGIFLLNYIKDIVEEYSSYNIFTLIDISLTDNSFKKNYNKKEKEHRNIIKNEDILNEYYEHHQN